MPSIITTGAASAKAFGWTNISLGSGNFITYCNYGVFTGSYNFQTIFYSVAYDSVNKVSIIGAFTNADGSDTAPYTGILKFSNTGSLLQQTNYKDSTQAMYPQYPGTTILDTNNNIVIGTQFNSNQGAGFTVYNSSGVAQSNRYALVQAGSDAIATYATLKDSSGNFLLSIEYVLGSGGCCPTYLYYPGFVVFNSSYTFQRYYYVTNAPSASFTTNPALDSSGNIWSFSGGTHTLFKYTTPSNGTGSFRSWTVSSGVTVGHANIPITTSDGTYIYGSGYDDSVFNKAIIIKVNSSFAFQWGTTVTISNANLTAESSVTDSSGNTYSLFSDGSSPNSAIIIKTNSSGTVQWVRRLSLTSFTSAINPYLVGYQIILDNLGNFILSGQMNYTTNSNHYWESGLLCSFPIDGSKTGTITDNSATFTYSSVSATTGSAVLSFGSSTNNTLTTIGVSSTATLSSYTNSLNNYSVIF